VDWDSLVKGTWEACFTPDHKCILHPTTSALQAISSFAESLEMQWQQQNRHSTAAAPAASASNPEASYQRSLTESLERRLEASERTLEGETSKRRRLEAENKYLQQDLARSQESSARHLDLWSQGEVALAKMQRRQDDLLRELLALQGQESAGMAQSAAYSQEVMDRFFRSTHQQRGIDAMTHIADRSHSLARMGLIRRAIGQWAVGARESTVQEEALYEHSVSRRKQASLEVIYRLQAQGGRTRVRRLVAEWHRSLVSHRVAELQSKVAGMSQENATAERSMAQLDELDRCLVESRADLLAKEGETERLTLAIETARSTLADTMATSSGSERERFLAKELAAISASALTAQKQLDDAAVELAAAQKDCMAAERALAKASAKDDEIAELEEARSSLRAELGLNEAAMVTQRNELGLLMASQLGDATKKSLALERKIRKLECALAKAEKGPAGREASASQARPPSSHPLASANNREQGGLSSLGPSPVPIPAQPSSEQAIIPQESPLQRNMVSEQSSEQEPNRPAGEGQQEELQRRAKLHPELQRLHELLQSVNADLVSTQNELKAVEDARCAMEASKGEAMGEIGRLRQALTEMRERAEGAEADSREEKENLAKAFEESRDAYQKLLEKQQQQQSALPQAEKEKEEEEDAKSVVPLGGEESFDGEAIPPPSEAIEQSSAVHGSDVGATFGQADGEGSATISPPGPMQQEVQVEEVKKAEVERLQAAVLRLEGEISLAAQARDKAERKAKASEHHLHSTRVELKETQKAFTDYSQV